MRYVELGATGLKVSAVAFGGMSLGNKADNQAEHDRRGRQAAIKAFELGINLFDTADVYGRGRAEEAMGAALREGAIPRDRVVIASKCGIVFPGDEPRYRYKAYDSSAGHVIASCENSLRRLGTDYIDLYQIHRIDYLTHPEELAGAMEKLKAAGKVRHAAVSNYTPDEIRALSAYVRLESLQAQFSLLHLEPLETGLASVCLEKKMALLCYSPLHRGVLSGGKALAHNDWQAQRELGVVAQLKAFAEKHGRTLGQIALAWLMHLPGGVIPLVGTANPDHIAEAAGAAEVELARDEWYELTVIARGRPMPWGQRPFVYMKDR